MPRNGWTGCNEVSGPVNKISYGIDFAGSTVPTGPKANDETSHEFYAHPLSQRKRGRHDDS